MSNYWADKCVVVTGGAGFLGRHVCDLLQQRGCTRLVVPRSAEYDLTRPTDVATLYSNHQPDVVLHLAARVGGIGANRTSPGTFLYANAMMGIEMLEQARIHRVEKFVTVGTVCAYPKHCPVPFNEDDIWDGYPEETNAPYGLAKKLLLVQSQAYRDEFGLNAIYLLPTNLYGPGDNFDPATSHVIPALIRKCIEARDAGDAAITCWGTGTASREFLYVADAAEGIVRAAETYDDPDPINLGTGAEITVDRLATMIAMLTGFQGALRWDPSQPDGQPRRCLDTRRAKDRLGFSVSVSMEEGLRRTIDWYASEGRSLESIQKRLSHADSLADALSCGSPLNG
jgi:GDP-L-fucose synthase